jgi:hypothetical protein
MTSIMYLLQQGILNEGCFDLKLGLIQYHPLLPEAMISCYVLSHDLYLCKAQHR